MLWNNKNDEFKNELRNEALKNELASKFINILGGDVAILHKELEKWNRTMDKMTQDYEETIHSLMPETFENKWINNIERKDKLVWWKYLSLLTLGNSSNFFVY